MNRQERQQRRLQRHHERRGRAFDRQAAADQRVREQHALVREAWDPDMDTSRIPPHTEMDFGEAIRPVVIVGLPGPWYLAKRLIGVYLVLLAITAGVALVVALAIASCGALSG